jgi:PD-(D/E)XK nuclease superfamily
MRGWVPSIDPLSRQSIRILGRVGSKKKNIVLEVVRCPTKQGHPFRGAERKTTLYPLIRNTEFRLESERNQYVLRGVVDVLARNPNAPDDPAQMEIWDYKGTRLPDLSSSDLRDYVWQMCVYAELYRVRSGTYPARAILYFLNELDLQPEPVNRPLRAVHEVQFTPTGIQQALTQFDVTAQSIMTCRTNNVWPLPTAAPAKESCDICDIRWNCPVPSPPYRVRMPIA